jgi:hypothetical protein
VIPRAMTDAVKLTPSLLTMLDASNGTAALF